MPATAKKAMSIRIHPRLGFCGVVMAVKNVRTVW